MGKMKGFAMLRIGEVGWIEKDIPKPGPMDAICKPLAIAICTSDVHTVWEGAVGDRHNMILGHEGCAEVVEVGECVKDFKPGDRVLVPAITPDWNSLEAQAGYSMHSGGMLAGWKFSNFKDGLDAEFFHVTRKEWHGFTITPSEPLPGGKLKFDFKPDTMTTLWINAAGKAPDGSPRKLDKPVNMYGSNVAKPGVWSPVEIDTTKAHIVGQNGAGALESVSRIELKLHPHQYARPGTYRGEIRNLRYEIAE